MRCTISGQAASKHARARRAEARSSPRARASSGWSGASSGPDRWTDAPGSVLVLGGARVVVAVVIVRRGCPGDRRGAHPPTGIRRFLPAAVPHGRSGGAAIRIAGPLPAMHRLLPARSTPARALLAPALLALASPAPADELFGERVAPVLEQNCLRCHGSATAKAGLSLATPRRAARGVTRRARRRAGRPDRELPPRTRVGRRSRDAAGGSAALAGRGRDAARVDRARPPLDGRGRARRAAPRRRLVVAAPPRAARGARRRRAPGRRLRRRGARRPGALAHPRAPTAERSRAAYGSR